MATCETCGNDYANPLEIIVKSQRHVFDCFECAIAALAPVCAHCDCKVIGHGVEANGLTFCCAHCARKFGHAELRDHA